MQYSKFFCGGSYTGYTETASDLSILGEGVRLTSITLQGFSRLYSARCYYKTADGRDRWDVMHGKGETETGTTSTLHMTPYWDPNDPNDRIVAVGACCDLGVDLQTIVLRTANGSLVGRTR